MNMGAEEEKSEMARMVSHFKLQIMFNFQEQNMVNKVIN